MLSSGGRPIRVKIMWRSGDRAGRARLSETAGSPATYPRLGPMLLPLATVLGLTGCSYVLGPAVSERHALPARSPDTTKNHASLQSRTPP